MFSAKHTALQPIRPYAVRTTPAVSIGTTVEVTMTPIPRKTLEKMECICEVRTGLIGYTDTLRVTQDSNYISYSLRNTIHFSRWGVKFALHTEIQWIPVRG
jgi:hypothetical protein